MTYSATSFVETETVGRVTGGGWLFRKREAEEATRPAAAVDGYAQGLWATF